MSESAALPKDEQMALTRDGMSRDHPDELLGGFFAAWPAVLWILSGNLTHEFSKTIQIFYLITFY